ncbi:protein-disulfide reductase DsbD [Rheinheimera texasensis]|uniref:protein-disulfide reductase DsbD n=1 Tax=Rheinheimera texasensis TaxID=306205 RepID=UPI0032B20A36
MNNRPSFVTTLYALLLWVCMPLQAAEPTTASQNPIAAPNILAALQQPQFLPVDQAFMLDFAQSGESVRISFQIADGYYLYKHKLKIAGVAVNFSNPVLPAGLPHEDEYFGKTEIYRHQLVFDVKLANIDADAKLKIRYQGCADAGLCYPVETREIPLIGSIKPDSSIAASSEPTATAAVSAAPVSSQVGLAERLSSDKSLLTLGLFFLLGLGLAFTPCVFPMYPILTSIIVGQGQQLSHGRAFRLSFAYVQGMALTYSALGLVVASAGVKFQAAFQHPAVLVGMSLLFVLLAGAMFGWINLQLPARWTEKLTATSNRQQGGSVKGALVMGALSGLVASPCTTAPLTGVLLYIAQSGDLAYGALVLYILSLGMGLPLLILGSSGGKWLPKPGAWMDVIKAIFGFLLLSVPLMLISRIVAAEVLLVLGSLLALGFALYLQQVQQLLKTAVAKSLCWLVATLLVCAVVLANYQQWLAPAMQPQPAAISATDSQQAGKFIDIKTLADLDAQLAEAKAQNQYVMLDLFAEWCVACKEFEHITFADTGVKAEMAKIRLLRIDVTKATEQDQQVLDKFQVLGLPTLLFFAPNGSELTTSRITGFMGPDAFKAHLTQLQQ